MRKLIGGFAAAALYALIVLNGPARADVVITSFEDFFENALYASWASPTAYIDYGSESYSVTASGYGSNWTYIGGLGVLGAGNTHLQLDVTLEGPATADALLGPIITLVDADGSNYNFAWYGQLLGNHILTMPVDAPTWIGGAGTVPGLDLDHIDHLHLQLDPSSFTGEYTVRWNELSLITIAGVPGDFNGDSIVDGRDLLAWQQGESPAPLSAADLATWKGAYGAGSLAAISTVPEPSSIFLLLLSGVGLCGRPRR
jgi:hypothetical protein